MGKINVENSFKQLRNDNFITVNEAVSTYGVKESVIRKLIKTAEVASFRGTGAYGQLVHEPTLKDKLKPILKVKVNKFQLNNIPINPFNYDENNLDLMKLAIWALDRDSQNNGKTIFFTNLINDLKLYKAIIPKRLNQAMIMYEELCLDNYKFIRDEYPNANKEYDLDVLNKNIPRNIVSCDIV